MLKQHLYYTLKPFLPWRIRMALRRISAKRARKTLSGHWPIDESAGIPPANWRGWPDGKKFAFVITHDVEGPDGLAKCQQLAELEIAAGVRSCFNFIPEGSYAVPAAFREWLTDRGFEVGVHDLHHDGRLFSSKRSFIRKSVRINHYLKTWGAAGFRGGFMLRNLEWLHQLNIRYDSSTFDTDPFELQPEGVKTIFPFWISQPVLSGGQRTREPAGSVIGSRGGYVELPYTLPQDSTLFLVLEEKAPTIWTKKLDWIADHGGMALVNVHPDYLVFDGGEKSARTFSFHFYAELIRHLQNKHGGAFWQPVPKDVASHVYNSFRQTAQ
jgi:hypothetical protein